MCKGGNISLNKQIKVSNVSGITLIALEAHACMWLKAEGLFENMTDSYLLISDIFVLYPLNSNVL